MLFKYMQFSLNTFVCDSPYLFFFVLAFQVTAFTHDPSNSSKLYLFLHQHKSRAPSTKKRMCWYVFSNSIR